MVLHWLSEHGAGVGSPFSSHHPTISNTSTTSARRGAANIGLNGMASRDLKSSPSSGASFYTANGSLSSPVPGQAAPGDSTESDAVSASNPFRDAKPLPRELMEHSQIHMEERLGRSSTALHSPTPSILRQDSSQLDQS